MINLFVNALSAKAGGGLTYARSVIPRLSRHPDLQTVVLAPEGLSGELTGLPGVRFIEAQRDWGDGFGRFWKEQSLLPAMLRENGSDVLLSLKIFGLLRPPVPQILIAGNALYTSRDFYSDALTRGGYAICLDTFLKTWLAKRSVRAARFTVTPSAAFADEIAARWAPPPESVKAVPYGFDEKEFFTDDALPPDAERRFKASDGVLRILFVSHYNWFRNFDTVIRALPILKARLKGQPFKLVLTCEIRPKPEWGPYDASASERLVRRLGVGGDILELGLIPHRALHRLYRACDLYLSPAYVESFAHPTVEAMASGLPIVASDIPVHREVCQDAALYFDRFSPEELASRIAELAQSPELAGRLKERGKERIKDFSWARHVEGLLELMRTACGR